MSFASHVPAYEVVAGDRVVDLETGLIVPVHHVEHDQDQGVITFTGAGNVVEFDCGDVVEVFR